MNNRFRDNNTKSIQEILNKILDSPELRQGVRETRVLKAWNSLLGPMAEKITKNIYIKGGVLYVSLNSSVIRNDLLMHKSKIIESLNKEAGAKVISDIVLR